MSAALVILPAVWATAAPSRVKTLPEVVQQKKTAPELAFYRKYTEGMLRRYVRLSMEAGRAPPLLGREMFRGKVTSYRVHSFEDVVIFVHDVETCLKKLDEQYADALDELTEIFLERKLLEPAKACQEAGTTL
jgi:hypothetical protein